MLNNRLKHFPLLFALLISSQAFAATVADDFTQATVNDSPGGLAATPSVGNGLNWTPINYACLTAGTPSNNSTTVATTSSTYSNIPGCNYSTPDAVGSGALRLTPSVNSQSGAIVSQETFPSTQGLQVTFTTYTYGGDSGGIAKEGADGIGFFLQDGSVGTTVGGASNLGSWGGSLGYSCSNSNGPYTGLTGGYLGLGMDEFGNFLNYADNTATGIPVQTQISSTNTACLAGENNGCNNFVGSYDQQSNRIGLRGAGNVSWYWLNANYPTLYPSTLSSSAKQTAVQNTCKTGKLYNYSGSKIGSVSSGSSMNVTSYGTNGPTLYDYPVIPNGYYVLPAANLIAKESATTRANATPITYRLIITPGGLLSFMYSYNGGAYNSVLTNFPITTSNGPLPSTFRFGFAGSTGGSRNVHEISCFVAEPVQSSTSAGANTIQSGQVRTGTQVYFASYNPNGWSGSLVSKAIVNTSGVLTINTTADWDGNCVLTGGTCPNTGVAIATPEAATYSTNSRQLLTWNGSTGVPLEWANLTTTATTGQQAILNSTDSNGTNRLNWLRGDRSQEQANAGPLRTRGGVLGDIVDSSPLWVGPPSLSYTSPFPDFLYATAVSPPENASGAQAYSAYASSLLTRMNVVYAGGNDGLLHGFRAGHNNSDGSYNEQANNPDGIANDGLNDGQELIGFMPSTVLASANVVGLTNPTYGHNYFVDAPPGTGDLFYNKAWHSWLVGGVGPGGAEIYALDVSDPAGTVTTSSQFSEPNASNLVIGDWTSSSLTTLTCVNALANCGNNLGNTYGTPLIRRLHNGQWAIIFGNGLSSANNHAGVFIGLVNSSTGAVSSFYWLDTGAGSSSSPDGIAYVASADLDGDHITDYLYAGDLLGNLWRFDLTSSNPADWGTSTFGHTSATPLFTATSSTGTVQPITTKVAVTATIAGGQLRVLLGFGTGQANPFTTTTGVTYASGKQTVYGIWDWDMNLWNNGATTTNNVTIPPSTSPYAALAEVRSTAPTTYQTALVTRARLLQDTSTETGATITVPATRTMAISTVSWCNSTTCSTPNNQYGWYYDLPDTVTSTACGGSVCNEQLIYSPVFSGGALLFNSTIPATTTLGQCSPSLPASWTNGLDMASGGGFAQNFFPDPNGNLAVTSGYNSITGIKQDSVGTPYVVAIGSKQYAVNPNANGAGNISQINPQGGVVVTRKTWEEIR